ncbi:MAG: hypothetical protein LRY41_02545 [Candidatus Pacebacteria bacterium]|nr:hypothetical protein [Candidatus Paceibacterota bacterium]MCD8508186.1 hypothetical protein [Candidatus Paceibacterota bacterium]MCD8528181.1 hypothetical protein [Candidatus Paceibacterota bacterium]MCD8563451.1 hypothetical protein [Candidatus Paceibacterota bacterium]
MKDIALKIGGGIIVVGLIILAYIFLRPNNTAPQGTLVSSSGAPVNTTASTQSMAGSSNSELLQLLNSIRGIRLDNAVLLNPAFAELRDITIPVSRDGATGRINPFAPLGSDPAPAAASIGQNTLPETSLESPAIGNLDITNTQ